LFGRGDREHGGGVGETVADGDRECPAGGEWEPDPSCVAEPWSSCGEPVVDLYPVGLPFAQFPPGDRADRQGGEHDPG
jgi:hypothetical protein